MILELNNMALNDARYETEKNIINQINIVSLSVSSVFIGGNLSQCDIRLSLSEQQPKPFK